MRFIVNRIYNGDFAAGSTSDIAVSEVGSGSGSANYANSLSPNLPGWVVAQSDGTVALVSDTAASGGFALKMAPSAVGNINRVYQDIPVVPGEVPQILRNWRFSRTTGDISLSIYCSYRKSDHSIIGGVTSFSIGFTTNIAAYQQIQDILGIGAAPANATYLRYVIEVTHNTATNHSVLFSDIKYLNQPDAFTPFAGSDLTLTTSFADVSGTSVTLEHGKTYLITACVQFEMSVAGVGDMTAQMLVDGSAQSGFALFTAPTATTRATVSATWVVTTDPVGTGVCKLQAKKSINVGTAKVIAANTTISVVCLSR
jgi:hypothetical protein